MKSEFDEAARRLWNVEDFVQLKERVSTEELGNVMIEQFSARRKAAYEEWQ